MYVILRLIIGSVFLVSGFSKVLAPYQNFLYVVQAYQLLPSWAETLTAQIFPWIELLTGVFMFLGLWTPWALRGAVTLFGVFVVVVGQALIRHLALDNCGCFGEWIHLQPQTVIVMDSFSLLLTFVLLRHISSVKKFSLDSYFDKA